MAFLMPSEPDARVPYGNLADPDTLLSSETFSDSSLNSQSISAPPGRYVHAPKKGKDTSHTAHSHDLILDDLPPLCTLLCRSSRRRQGEVLIWLFELLLGTSIKYSHKHLSDWQTCQRVA